jgi:NDP-sugar pyrophosphorylase family protein
VNSAAAHDLAGVVLAAGLGTRLRPLTDLRPKALCPVANVALVDHAIARVTPFVNAVAVNAHAHAEQLVAHVGTRAYVSVEQPRPLGTAGALGRLREWADGRALLVTNADAWHDFTLDPLVDGWDGTSVRVVVVRDDARGDFGPWRYAGSCLLPAAVVATLDETVSGLYERVWRPREHDGTLQLVPVAGEFVDCGTPADYLLANLLAANADNVADDAVVRGTIERCVVWPGARVDDGEHLVECIRATPSLTVDAALGERRARLRT